MATLDSRVCKSTPTSIIGRPSFQIGGGAGFQSDATTWVENRSHDITIGRPLTPCRRPLSGALPKARIVPALRASTGHRLPRARPLFHALGAPPQPRPRPLHHSRLL